MDVIQNYVAIVKENKGTTTFTSLHTPVEVAEVVKEVRLFILKKDRQLNPVRSEDITLSINDEPVLRYREQYDQQSFFPLNERLEVRWNQKDGFDFVALRRRGLSSEWLNDEQPGNEERPSPYSIKLHAPELSGLTDESIFVVPGESWIYLDPVVPPQVSSYHPFEISLDVWKDNLYSVPPEENLKLGQIEAWLDMGQVGQNKNDGTRYELAYDSATVAYKLDVNRRIPDLKEGEYWASFFAKSRFSDIPPRIDSIPFFVVADYLKPLYQSTEPLSDWRVREVPLGLSIDRNAERFKHYFDVEQPLTEVNAIITSEGSIVENVKLGKVAKGQSPEGILVYKGSWLAQSIGKYEVHYEIKGYRNSDELANTTDYTTRMELVSIYRSPWHAVIRLE